MRPRFRNLSRSILKRLRQVGLQEQTVKKKGELNIAVKQTVKDLLEDEIKDLYSAEKQLTKAIPKMAKGSNDPELEAAFRSHLKETEGQVTRLEKVAEILETKPTGKKCMGMEGVIE